MNAPKDTDQVGFGRYRHDMYADVPADYWWYIWNSGLRNETEKPAHRYIVRNWKHLAKDNKNFADEIPPEVL